MHDWHEIFWNEGMLLRPQHLQAFQRYVTRLASAGLDSLLPFTWGFKDLHIDTVALEAGIFSIDRCILRLPSGSWLNIPENTELSARSLSIPEARRSQGVIRVYLGVPHMRQGDVNVAAGNDQGEQLEPRYAIQTLMCVDENTGQDARSIEIRRFQAKLLLDSDDLYNYEFIEVARVHPIEGGRFRLDGQFVPPVLSVKTSPLLVGYLHDLLMEIRFRAREIADVMVQQHLLSEFHSDVVRPLKLSVLNEATELFDALLTSGHVSPYTMYLQLRRLLGRLSAFERPYLPPPIPAYAHDDCGSVFFTLIQAVRLLLHDVTLPNYIRIPFIREAFGMIAKILGDITLEQRTLYVGVDMPGLDVDEAQRTLTSLQWSMMPSPTVPDGESPRHKGLDLKVVEAPPNLPDRNGRFYFEIVKTGQAWERLVQEKAMRLYSRDENQLQTLEAINLSLYIV
jgi:type VI secretion system protein ImpJ